MSGKTDGTTLPFKTLNMQRKLAKIGLESELTLTVRKEITFLFKKFSVILTWNPEDGSMTIWDSFSKKLEHWSGKEVGRTEGQIQGIFLVHVKMLMNDIAVRTKANLSIPELVRLEDEALKKAGIKDPLKLKDASITFINRNDNKEDR